MQLHGGPAHPVSRADADEAGQPALHATATYAWMTDAQADALLDPSPARIPEFAEYFRPARL